MKRNTGTEKIIYQIAVAGIIVISLVTVIVTAGLAWQVYGDLTKSIIPERQVPHINNNNVNKATDILNRKESSVKIDLKTREIKFGREEPFE